MLLSEIYCKITTNSDFDRVSIRNLLQNAMLEQIPDGHGLLEDAAVGVVLEAVKLAASIEKVFDSAK